MSLLCTPRALCAQGRAPVYDHGLSVGSKVEVLHPLSRRELCPATVVAVPNVFHYVVELDEIAPGDLRMAATPPPPPTLASTSCSSPTLGKRRVRAPVDEEELDTNAAATSAPDPVAGSGAESGRKEEEKKATAEKAAAEASGEEKSADAEKSAAAEDTSKKSSAAEGEAGEQQTQVAGEQADGAIASSEHEPAKERASGQVEPESAPCTGSSSNALTAESSAESVSVYLYTNMYYRILLDYCYTNAVHYASLIQVHGHECSP